MVVEPGDVDITERNQSYNRRILAGCGVVLLLLFLGIATSAVFALRHERQAAHYPGSVPISSHDNYKGLPTHIRWDNTYRSDDSFTKVYHWYSTGFELGSEARANGRCILLEGSRRRALLERHMSVLLCNTPNGQMIYVSRFTSLR